MSLKKKGVYVLFNLKKIKTMNTDLNNLHKLTKEADFLLTKTHLK